MNQSQRSTSTI